MHHASCCLTPASAANKATCWCAQVTRPNDGPGNMYVWKRSLASIDAGVRTMAVPSSKVSLQVGAEVLAAAVALLGEGVRGKAAGWRGGVFRDIGHSTVSGHPSTHTILPHSAPPLPCPHIPTAPAMLPLQARCELLNGLAAIYTAQREGLDAEDTAAYLRCGQSAATCSHLQLCPPPCRLPASPVYHDCARKIPDLMLFKQQAACLSMHMHGVWHFVRRRALISPRLCPFPPLPPSAHVGLQVAGLLCAPPAGR